MLLKLFPEIESSHKGQLRSDKLPDLKHVIIVDHEAAFSSSKSPSRYPGCWAYEELAESPLAPDEYQWPYVDADDLLMIHYTVSICFE